MYRKAAKRVLAVILAVCMAGSMPEMALQAASVDDAGVRQEAGTEMDGLMDTPEETETGVPLEEGASDLGKETEATPEEPAAGDALKRNEAREAAAYAKAGTIDLAANDGSITKPDTNGLPNQLLSLIEKIDADGFVSEKIAGLTITYNNTPDGEPEELQQILVKEEEGSDGYKVSAELNKEKTSATLRVTGSGRFTGTLTYNVDFKGDIGACDVALTHGSNTTGSYLYEGREIEPTVEVTSAGKKVDPANYTVEYRQNENVGTASAVIKSTKAGSYAGEKTVSFQITARQIDDADNPFFKVNAVSEVVYNKSKAQTGMTLGGSLKLTYVREGAAEGEPVKESDYTLKYEDNTSVTGSGNRAKLTITGDGKNCTGSISKYFTIVPGDFGKTDYDDDDKIQFQYEKEFSYTGSDIEPEVTVFQKDEKTGKLEEGNDKDYTVKYENNRDQGTGKIIVTGKGNYTGTRELEFKIGPFEMTGITAGDIGIDDAYPWTGNPITPRSDDLNQITMGSLTLQKGTDFDVEYQNNVNVGQATIRIIGKGNYSKEANIPFVIYKDISEAAADPTISVEPIADQQYTGGEVHPSVVVKDGQKTLSCRIANEERGYDYSLEYPSPEGYVNIGTGRKVRIVGDGTYYRGSREVSFNIVARNLSGVKVKFKEERAYVFNGDPIQPEAEVSLEGSSGDKIVFPMEDFRVTYAPDASVQGNNGNASCVNAGSYQVKIELKPDRADYYTGSLPTLSYQVQPKELAADASKYTWALLLNGMEMTETPYTGSDITPTASVKDLRRKPGDGGYSPDATDGYELGAADYKLSYADNRNNGWATVTIAGQKNYAGSILKRFYIKQCDLPGASLTIELGQSEYTYTGEAIVPSVTSVRIGDTVLDASRVAEEFTIRSEAVNVGDNYAFTLIGKKNFKGEVSSGAVTFRIVPRPIMEVDVEPIPNQAHTGGPLTPVPVMTYNGKELTAEDYDLSYVNNVDLDHGTTDPSQMPTVTITGKRNFVGTREVNFHICESILGATVNGWDNNFSGTFDSRPWKPWNLDTMSVTLNGRTLVYGDDYEVTYQNNVNAAKANALEKAPTMLITGIGEYGGTIRKTFTINPVEMKLRGVGQLEAPLSCKLGSSPMFTGSAVMPSLTITYKGTDRETHQAFTYTLVEGLDYAIPTSVQTNNVNAGDKYPMKVRPIGNFYNLNATGEGIILNNYKIVAKPLTSPEIVIEDLSVPETATLPVTPPVKIIDTKRAADGKKVDQGGSYALVLGTDYKVTYTNNQKPGTATATISGTGNYSGTIRKTFVIPGNLNNATVEFQDSTVGDAASGKYYFTGSEIKPKIKVTCGTDATGKEIALKQGTDYQYDLVGDRVNHGKPVVRLTGIGAYAGVIRDIPFEIVPRPLDDIAVKLKMAKSVGFKGVNENVWPEVTMVLGKYTLVLNSDYILTPEKSCWQSSLINGKKYTLDIVAGPSGNFSGRIDPKQTEYTIGNNFDVDIKFVTPSGNVSKYTTTYTGAEITPELVVTDNKKPDTVLVKGEDYDVTFSNNINAGQAKVTVFGLGGQEGKTTNYCGDKTAQFTIDKKDLRDNDIKVSAIPEHTYTSKQITPEPTVTWTKPDGEAEELVFGTDIKYSYKKNTNAGTATVTVEPANAKSNFKEKRDVTFTIKPKNIEDPDVTFEGIPDQVFTGAAIEPALNIHWGETAASQVALKKEDYEFAFGEEGNVNVGTVSVTIKGKGNYTGSISTQFRIVKVKLSDITPEFERTQKYTGKQICPELKMSYLSTDGKKIEMNSTEVWGYQVTYGPNTALGTTSGSITVTAIEGGNCEGDPVTWKFDIVPRPLTDEAILIEPEEIPDQIYAGKPCTPEVEITFILKGDRYTLKKKLDYTVEYVGNDTFNPKAEMIIKGLGNFSGTVTKNFKVAMRLSDFVSVKEGYAFESFVYNGAAQHPDVKKALEFTENLKEGTDYEVVWEDDCINAGEHKGKLAGLGNYSGEIPLPSFTIMQREISNLTFEVEDQVFNGSPIVPEILARDKGISEDIVGGNVYEILEIQNNTFPGTASVLVKAVDNSNYTGEMAVEFEILKADLQGDYIKSTTMDSPYAYTGEEIEPPVTITDTRRGSNGNALAAKEGAYYELKPGVDYEVTYENNIYPRSDSGDEVMPATATITGKGNYEGILTKIFDITADLEDAEISPIDPQPYTGEPVEPELSVRLGDKKLKEGVDYTVTYEDNTNRGMASATIHACGSLYSGEKTVYFSISRDIAGADIRLVAPAFTYTGKAIEPAAGVVFDGNVLKEDEDYELEYQDNVNVGTATVIIKGINGYDGGSSVTFSIIKRSVIRCSFDNVEDKVFDGTATSQSLLVSEGDQTLEEGRDYTVEYERNDVPGIATLTVFGNGNYGGQKTIRYLIHVADMGAVKASASADSVSLSWTAVPGAEGYAVYDGGNHLIARTTGLTYRHSNLNAWTSYAYKVRPYITVEGAPYYGEFSGKAEVTTGVVQPTVTLKAYKKKIKVSWKRINGVDGYEIYRKGQKDKKYKKVKTASKSAIVSYMNKKLTRKTKYSYKIRAYKRINGKYAYSSYSSVKSVKTK